MMGLKCRTFAPLGDRSLEELVPADNIYRRLARVLDLSFVHDLVADCYAAGGDRRSIPSSSSSSS